MAFMKYARASVVHPHIGKTEWAKVRVAAKTSNGDLNDNLVARASELLGKPFNPKDFLLTHATIVASVDTFEPTGIKTGSVLEGGFRVNRKYGNFRIKASCDKFINNNLDSWDRDVLLKSYRTFVGGHNFCFAPGTQVRLADGSYKPIEDVIVGDLVLTHMGRARKVTRLFKRLYEGDIQAVQIGRFKDPILATGNHPFRALSVEAPPLGRYKSGKAKSALRYRKDQIVKALRGEQATFGSSTPALRKVVDAMGSGPMTRAEVSSLLGCGDAGSLLRQYPRYFGVRPLAQDERPKLRGRSRPRKMWFLKDTAPEIPSQEVRIIPEWVNAGDLGTTSWVRGPNCNTGSVSSLKRASLLGYYAAEGCLAWEGNENPVAVILSFGPHERTLAEDAQKLAEDVWPEATVKIHPTQTSLRTTIRSKAAAAWFQKMCGHLAHLKTLHPSVHDWDRETQLQLLAAWMTGDGNLHKGTLRLRGASVSRKLSDQMQLVAEQCGLKSFTVFEKRNIGEVGSQVQMVVGGEPRIFDVISRHHCWTTYVSRSDCTEIVSRSKRWGPVVPVSNKSQDLAWWEGARLYQVTSNTSIPYSGYVHNIEVEEDHSYVVDHGVCVHNCEHVQVEELSKGRIIDSVARDIGDSVYTDILIATDRKHRDLVTAIVNGKMSTLSMGCSVDGTQCTKCGHWAADETEMCNCVKYAKGNIFFDENGNKHRVAELCGHKSIGPTGGVQFIEASWVATPAFTGAVLRNILEPTESQFRQVQAILNTPPPQWSSDTQMKAAFLTDSSSAFGFSSGNDLLAESSDFFAGWQDSEEPAEDAEAKPAEEPNPFKDIEEEMVTFVSDRVKKRLQEQMKGDEAEKVLNPETPTSTNETLVKEGSILRTATDVLIRTATTRAALVDGIAQLAQAGGINIPIRVYRVAVKMGSADFADPTRFQACLASLGQPSSAEIRVLRKLGKLIAHWERQTQGASHTFQSGSRHKETQ